MSSRRVWRLDNLALSSLAVAPALIGMGVGQILRERVSPAAFRRWFLIGLLPLGVADPDGCSVAAGRPE